MISIARMGIDGDGIGATADGSAMYVPFTLPGEVVRVAPTGRRGEGVGAALVTVEQSSPARVVPACRHFGACGGCALQHWRQAEYETWKADLLTAALRRAGYADVALAPLVPGAAASRRRVDLAVRRVGGAVRVGLHRAHGVEVIELAECPVLDPVLAGLLGPLQAVLARLAGLRREGSVVLNLLDSGPDLLLRTDAELSAGDRSLLAGFAQAQGIQRRNLDPQPKHPPPDLAAASGRIPSGPGVPVQCSTLWPMTCVATWSWLLASWPNCGRAAAGPMRFVTPPRDLMETPCPKPRTSMAS